MRYLRVHVKSGDGRQFVARAMEITEQRAILRGDLALPAGTACDLQIVVPPKSEKAPPTLAGMKAVVGDVVFAQGGIRLDLRVKSLSEEARQLIDAYKPGA